MFIQVRDDLEPVEVAGHAPLGVGHRQVLKPVPVVTLHSTITRPVSSRERAPLKRRRELFTLRA